MFVFQGSRDNMSVVLICFPGAPKVSPEAVKKEADLDKYLEGRVEGMFNRHLIGLSFLLPMLLEASLAKLWPAPPPPFFFFCLIVLVSWKNVFLRYK